ADKDQVARAKALIARSLSSRGSLEHALQWSTQAVASDSMNPEHRYHQGVILQELGRFEEAAASMEQALYLEPELPMALFSLGLMARRQGGETRAQRYFSRLLGVLEQYRDDDPVPLSEGLSAARLRELIESLLLSR
ncbi:MAG: tetratricopeptide repeat protein, partial [Oceanidesulfovibrio sp.]